MICYLELHDFHLSNQVVLFPVIKTIHLEAPSLKGKNVFKLCMFL